MPSFPSDFLIPVLSIALMLLILSYMSVCILRHKRAQRDAEEANDLKSQFLAIMSHEIRSPMSGVLGMAELLMNTHLTPEQRAYTKTILNSGETLLRIIEDILDVSKIEAHKIELDVVPVNMLELIDDTCALYYPRARDKALELAIRYVPGSEQFVCADPVRMRQIIGNLINNAIKFTDSGHIVVTVREDKTTYSDETCRLDFTIEDTGIGIPENMQARIFEKFAQADSSTTRLFGGTGLGLSICKNLVELMNGTIGVKSESGKGTCFFFSIPFRRSRQETLIPLQPPVLRDIKALVVDDFSLVRTLVAEQLTMAGMRCLSCGTAEEALKMMADAGRIGDPYKIIIIDYLLPGMNGEMLARKIRLENLYGNPCLVMLTAADNQATISDIKNGFSAFIAKPVQPDILIETLVSSWEKHRKGETGTIIRLDNHLQNYEADHTGIEADLSGVHVLLAEDSRINQSFVKDVLEPLGCTVDIASNGREAVEMIKTHSYNLVLMDCLMPIMDGFEAARAIRDLKGAGLVSQNTPVIALTANAMKGDREKCLSAGMDDYLSKPVRSRVLKEKIYSWTRHEPPRQAQESKIVSLNVSFDNDLLDLTSVNESRQIMKGKYSSMLDLYFEDVAGYLDEIKMASATGILSGAVRPAHTIKSTSLRMGAVKLSGLARDIETGLRDGSLTAHGLQLKYNDMAALFDITRQALVEQNLKNKAG